MSFHRIARAGDVALGTAKLVEVEGRIIALFHLKDGFFAIDDRCSHRGGPLSEGTLEGDQIVCPWHFGKFDVKTGRPTGGVVKTPQKCYLVRVSGDDVEIEV